MPVKTLAPKGAEPTRLDRPTRLKARTGSQRVLRPNRGAVRRGDPTTPRRKTPEAPRAKGTLETQSRAFPTIDQAPVFYPTELEFRDPLQYLEKIKAAAARAGICKIVPPTSWAPEFALDPHTFRFATRRMHLSSLEGPSRVVRAFVDQLQLFHAQQGSPFDQIPTFCGAPVDLLRLRAEVQRRGGFRAMRSGTSERMRWLSVAQAMGLDICEHPHAGKALQNAYERFILPYTEYLARNLRLKRREPVEKGGCARCGRAESSRARGNAALLQCVACSTRFHGRCVTPPPAPECAAEWRCAACLAADGDDYGFEDGGTYTLDTFRARADAFKARHFAGRPSGEEDVEAEFWALTARAYDALEVEYGADLHSSEHGSAFATLPATNPAAQHPWNLNNIPGAHGSLLRLIRRDISGMTVPWVYVGMCFSAFCWHVEDHHTYSINYLHRGAAKTWYGVPASDAALFEEAMRARCPELFAANPDLLFQLTTLLSPAELLRRGVRVFRTHQRAGEFVVTFPQAYHGGFNQGFNVAEAVNFCLPDWLPFGEAAVALYRGFSKNPVFSHDELLLAAARDAIAAGDAAVAAQLVAPVAVLCNRHRRRLEALPAVGLVEPLPDGEPESRQCAECRIFLHTAGALVGSAVACEQHLAAVCARMGVSVDSDAVQVYERHSVSLLDGLLSGLKALLHRR